MINMIIGVFFIILALISTLIFDEVELTNILLFLIVVLLAKALGNSNRNAR